MSQYRETHRRASQFMYYCMLCIDWLSNRHERESPISNQVRSIQMHNYNRSRREREKINIQTRILLNLNGDEWKRYLSDIQQYTTLAIRIQPNAKDWWSVRRLIEAMFSQVCEFAYGEHISVKYYMWDCCHSEKVNNKISATAERVIF